MKPKETFLIGFDSEKKEKLQRKIYDLAVKDTHKGEFASGTEYRRYTEEIREEQAKVLEEVYDLLGKNILTFNK